MLHSEDDTLERVVSTRGERLKQARERVFKSARKAAIALGVPVPTYNAHEHAQQPGGRDYGPEEAQLYARRFGVPLEYLLVGAVKVSRQSKTPPGPLFVPLVGYVDKGDQVYYLDKSEEVPPIEGATPDTVALELRNEGDYNGWLAYYDNVRETPPTRLLHQQVCVVQLSDRRIYMRRLWRITSRRGYWHLLSKNETPIMDVRPVWASRVLVIRPR